MAQGLADRVEQGQKAIALARVRGLDTQAWEDHLQEIVQYLSSAFGTLLRASSWTAGGSNITLSDIYSVLRPGHQGALSLSQVSDIERTTRSSTSWTMEWNAYGARTSA